MNDSPKICRCGNSAKKPELERLKDPKWRGDISERGEMARKRLIDTEELYFSSDLVEALGAKGLHLYIRLWGLAEDWGGYEPNYRDIAFRMGALKFTAAEVQKFIESLIRMGKIFPFQGGVKTFHWLAKLLKHQPLNNPSPPKLPLPEWIYCEIKKFKSGKSYAEFKIIPEKLPVGYQYPNGNEHTETEKKQNRNRIETNIATFFDTFWHEYPQRNGKKVGKAEALKVWKEIKPDETLQNTILTSLKNQKENFKYLSEIGEFVAPFPDPHRWLKKKRWEDEVKDTKELQHEKVRDAE
jgi:hypothetical protein